MAVKGVFASDQNIAGTPKGDFASAILQVHPTGSAPLLALSSGMQSSDVKSVVTTWFEENHLAGYLTVTNAAGTGTSLNFSVADISELLAGMLILNQGTGEYIFIESISGLVATVTRGFGGTTNTSISATDKVQIITTAHEEGSSKPTSIANVGYPRFNYMQIMRDSWDATGTAKAVAYHTGDVVAKNKADAGVFHAEKIEKAFLWGKKTIGTLNNKPFRTMDGIVNQITTNTSSQTTNTQWEDIDLFLQTIFERNIKGQPNERIAFCGNTVIGVLNKIAQLDGVINLDVGQTEFGMKISKWLTPYGDISLMTHPLMNENPIWSKQLYVLHPAAIRVKYLRRTFHDTNDKAGTRAGSDADFGVFTTEATIEYAGELTGGIYTGIDTAAAS